MSSRFVFKYNTRLCVNLCLGLLILSCRTSAQEDGHEEQSPANQLEEFDHLLNLISHSKRIHVTSEITRNGHRLQIEEFVDLNTWSQFVQFKWHEEIKGAEDANSKLTTHKFNLLILNDREKKIQVDYVPYACNIKEFNSTKANDLDWRQLFAKSLGLRADDTKISASERHEATISSILTIANNSPYLARIPETGGYDAWLFGISGLWIKAQYPGANNAPPRQLLHEEDGKRMNDAFSWRLDLIDADTTAYYYTDGFMLSNSQDAAKHRVNDFKSMTLIELRNLEGNQVKDLINIIDVDFGFSDDVARNIFKLPMGYNCPRSSIYQKIKPYLGSSISSSKLIEFEISATRFSIANELEDTVIKSMFVGTSKHPMNSASFLTMLHLPEDGIKVVRDFHSRIRYTIDTSKRSECTIDALHIFDFNHYQSYDPVEVRFKNGITFIFKELFLDYLLFVDGSSSKYGFHIIDQSSSSKSKTEIVLESEVTDSFRNLLTLVNEEQSYPEILGPMSIVRVFEKTSKTVPYVSSSYQRGALKLVRVTLIVFDVERLQKLAEVTFNLINSIEPVSFSKKANMFDISKCYSPAEKTMQLVITYAGESQVLDYAEARSDEMVEEFYKTPVLWSVTSKIENEDEADKKRLAISSNFLRLPKVEMRRAPDGLKLYLTVIDKASPLHLFSQMVESTFETSALDENLLLSTVEQCASHCQFLGCNMFAFDTTSRECKLSRETLELSNIDGGEEVVRQIRQPSSTIYYEPIRNDEIDQQTTVSEATLGDLHSYIQHNFFSSETIIKTSSADDDELLVVENKIEPVARWPLFSFQFADRSVPRVQYQPPKMRLMVPTKIELIHTPFSLDITEETQKHKVAASFKVDDLDRSYMLNIFDDSETPEKMRQANERTFINQNLSVYYTLRRIVANDQESCALLCYNIEDWDSKTESEQTCMSFSYCSMEQQCILLIKTDFNFVDNVLDLVEEGDRVYSAESSSDFLRPMKQCILISRKYLTKYEGPFLLDCELLGRASTNEINSGPDFEWITLPSVTTDSFDIDKLTEKCFKECTKYNRDGQYCLAVDFCIKEVDQHKKWQFDCQILVVGFGSDVAISDHIVSLRGHLVVATPSNQTDNETSDKSMTCSRYLASHLGDYHHIKQRKLSQSLMAKLDTPVPPLSDLNLDQCALECSIKPSNCMTFEYCSNLDKSTHKVIRNCSLFGWPIEEKRDMTNIVEPGELTILQVSEYSRGCHIYLRRRFTSLSDLFTLKDGKPTASTGLSISFWILVLSIAVIGCAIIFLLYKRTR